MSNATRRLLRWAEVEALCGISRSTGWRWIKRGAFPAPLKVGPYAYSARWDSAEIDEWLAEQAGGVGVTGGDDGDEN